MLSDTEGKDPYDVTLQVCSNLFWVPVTPGIHAGNMPSGVYPTGQSQDNTSSLLTSDIVGEADSNISIVSTFDTHGLTSDSGSRTTPLLSTTILAILSTMAAFALLLLCF